MFWQWTDSNASGIVSTKTKGPANESGHETIIYNLVEFQTGYPSDDSKCDERHQGMTWMKPDDRNDRGVEARGQRGNGRQHRSFDPAGVCFLFPDVTNILM